MFALYFLWLKERTGEQEYYSTCSLLLLRLLLTQQYIQNLIPRLLRACVSRCNKEIEHIHDSTCRRLVFV